ncbi:MAG: DUF3800 domain-containing protein [Methylotenera sp.]
MTLQAFIDDSYENDGVYVLAGCISNVEGWVNFSKDWQKILPNWGTLNPKTNKYHFKMSEMNATKERMERVPVFLGTIEEHVLGFVYVKINISELNRALNKLQAANADIIIDWACYADPFYVACRCLLDKFHLQRNEMIEALGEEKIDFYFDEQSNKNSITSIWDSYISERPEQIREYYGATPSFKDDEDFLPLQGADLYAWWVRKCYKDGTPEKIDKLDFGEFKPSKQKKLLRVSIEFNESHLIENLHKILQRALPSRIIYAPNSRFY